MPIHRRALTPSERRQLESTRVDPVIWGEWIAILVVLGGSLTGMFWLAMYVLAWGTNSPTARLVMQ